MRVYPHLFSKLFASPLMLHEPVRLGLERELLTRMGVTHSPRPRSYGDPAEPFEDSIEIRKRMQATNDAWRVESIYQTFGNVGVVSITGVIDKHMSDFDMSCYGGCDLADVDRALSIAANDSKIERVALYVNSPGGSCIGVPETAARVAALTKEKEVHTFVDGVCASAAIYIGSQADKITAAPSAMLGSIGVYLAVLDESRALEMEGYKVELIKAGKFKAMGASFKPLSDEERAMLQAEVDEIYREFTGAVRARRGNIADETMQGQTFRGTKAKQVGLVDELFTGNLDEFVAGLLSE